MSKEEKPAAAPRPAPPPPRAPGSKHKLVGMPIPKDGLPGTTASAGTIGIWGSANASVTGYGTISSASMRKTATRDGYANNEGEFTGYCYYNFVSEGEFEALLPSTGLGSALDAGDTISIGGESLCVDEATQLWANAGWEKYRVRASKHATVSLI
jgi:hypothetical protein